MQPVLILQHLSDDGPSFLTHWLSAQGVPWQLRCSEAGQDFPERIDGHSALAILGGAMSANDPLPGLRQAERLIVACVATGVPVIGHCLGGQLMARALGGRVAASPRPEVGWHAVQWAPEAQAWFGDGVHDGTEVFHWHGEAFSLPPGAVALGRSPACAHQAFALGPHLAMQFHIELDADKLARWAADTSAEYQALQAAFPAEVQAPAALRHDAARRLARQQRMASVAYQRWLAAADGRP